MDNSSPGVSSSGESTSSSPISTRTNPLISPHHHPLPQVSSYELLQNNQNHLQLSTPHHHPHHVSPRYVSVLSSSCIDTSYSTPTNAGYSQNNPENLTHPDIKFESPLHVLHHREHGEIFKNLDNLGENPNQRLTVGKYSLSLTQIECICEAMLQRKDIKRLDDFLKSIPQRFNGGSESIYRAKVHVLFDRQNFTEMYKLMESYNYSTKYHGELQELWYQAHYKEQENIRGRSLGAVDKYRIRNKFQLPKTIWDGEKTTYCFKDRAREALKDCYSRCRYPTPNEKKALSEMTGLTAIQVSNWFKNKRQRDRTPQTRDEVGLGGTLAALGPHSGSHGYGKGDDSSNDMKPLVFRSSTPKRLKLNKPILSDGRVNMLDLGHPIALTRKDSIYPALSHVTISPSRTTNHLQGNNLSSHSNNPSEVSGHNQHGNNVSVIQSLGGAHCQFYPQPPSSHYENLINSPHHYTSHSHANSPQILSYG